MGFAPTHGEKTQESEFAMWCNAMHPESITPAKM
jgi:hypothetical protein